MLRSKENMNKVKQPKVQYLYVRDHNNFPVGTFAYKVKQKKDGSFKLSYAYSVFYMRDQYIRAYGRNLTRERLEDSPCVLKGDCPERLLVQAVRAVSKAPVNYWAFGGKGGKEKNYPRLGHRFASACRFTAAKLGAVLGKQTMAA